MYIPIYVLVIAGILGFIFLTPYRQGICNFFGVIWDIICGIFVRIWDFLRGATPAAGATVSVIAPIAATGLRIFLAIVLAFALLFILFVLAVHVFVAWGILSIGNVTGNSQAAMYFLIALIIWGIFSTIPAMVIFWPIRFMSRWIARPVAIILALYLFSGVLWYVYENRSPQIATSLGRSGNATIEGMANSLDKHSVQSESEAGIFARVSKNTRVYNSADQPFTSLKKGDMVYVLGLQGKKKTINREGLTQIMLPNQDGEFVRGKRGWIPSRIIDWEESKPEDSNSTVTLINPQKVTERITFDRLGCASVRLKPGWYTVDNENISVSLNNWKTFQRVSNMSGGRFKVEKEDLFVFKGPPHGNATIVPVS